jgi:hypothetical protein
MATIPAVVTDASVGLTGLRRSLPQMLGGVHLLAFQPLVPGGFFKMGTYNIAGSPGPLDDTLTDLVAPEATSQKSLTTSDVTYVSPNTLRVRCFLDTTEGNGAGSVTYYEIGIYDAAGRLITHGTMTAQLKNNGVTLENFVNITF